jgi:hypothetical protein
MASRRLGMSAFGAGWAKLFLKARLGWREEERRAERARNSRELWEAERKAMDDAERDLDAKLARLRRPVEAGETGGSSAG